jgi:hypothetical protein
MKDLNFNPTRISAAVMDNEPLFCVDDQIVPYARQ